MHNLEEKAIFSTLINKWQSSLENRKNHVYLIIHELDDHLILPNLGQTILAESLLFTHYVPQKRLRESSPSSAHPTFDLKDLLDSGKQF